MTHPTASERGEVIEAATIAGYEARACKTGSPKWGYRDPDSQRRYREIVTAAFEALEAMGVIDLSPQTQPPTPDAIRAAIAEILTEYLTPGVWPLVIRTPESRDANVKAIAWRIEHRLAQIGAVPAAGMVTISRETARRAHSALVYLRVAKDEMQDDEEQRAERELASALAGGADDGVPDPNTPEGGNTPFDPREWVDEETGERFTDDEDVPTKAALLDAIGEYARKNRRAHECSTEEYIQSKTESWRAVRALIDRLPIANGEDT